MVIPKKEAVRDESLITILKRGGICILPCDTIYGFTGIGPEAEEKIRAVKSNSGEKKYLRLIKSGHEIYNYISKKIDNCLLHLWPGPLTLIVNDQEGEKIGLRVPDDVFLSTILDKIGEPLISTSVNRSGEEPMIRIKKIINIFEPLVDAIVDGGDLTVSLPSTVLDVTQNPYRVIRQGAFTIPEDMQVIY